MCFTGGYFTPGPISGAISPPFITMLVGPTIVGVAIKAIVTFRHDGSVALQDLFAKIGLPGGKSFSTTSKDRPKKNRSFGKRLLGVSMEVSN